jgi:hypothetical protein
VNKIGVKVRGSGLKRIIDILLLMKVTTSPTFVFSPYFTEYDEKPFLNSCLGLLPFCDVALIG